MLKVLVLILVSTRDAEGAVWSWRCFLPSFGLLDAVFPREVISTANKAPVGLGNSEACMGSTSTLYRELQCQV